MPIFSGGSTPTPQYRRLMAFIDGENLVFNYQLGIRNGFEKHKDTSFCEDIYVWHPNTIQGHRHDVLRASFYTFAVGDDQHLTIIGEEIKKLSYYKDHQSILPNYLRPVVFKKDKQGKKTKGVDIQIAVDILTNLYNNNFDTALLVTGDGDFLPIINEITRQGKQVYLASFKSGLNSKLLNHVDQYIELDNIYFTILGS